MRSFYQSLDQYVQMFPDMIEVYATKKLVPRQNRIDTFSFWMSETGKQREHRLFKKDIPNTKVLYEKIIEEYLNYTLLTSYQYRFINDYFGIELQNKNQQKLTIFFVQDLEQLKERTIKHFSLQKRIDFMDYARIAIEQKEIQKVQIFRSKENKSSISYIKDNEEYTSSLWKAKQLVYRYSSSQTTIDTDDYITIKNMIWIYLLKYLEGNPNYRYQIDHRYLTTGLKISFAGNRSIELHDPVLIDFLEKDGLIDHIHETKINPDKVKRLIKQQVETYSRQLEEEKILWKS